MLPLWNQLPLTQSRCAHCDIALTALDCFRPWRSYRRSYGRSTRRPLWAVPGTWIMIGLILDCGILVWTLKEAPRQRAQLATHALVRTRAPAAYLHVEDTSVPPAG